MEKRILIVVITAAIVLLGLMYAMNLKVDYELKSEQLKVMQLRYDDNIKKADAIIQQWQQQEQLRKQQTVKGR